MRERQDSRPDRQWKSFVVWVKGLTPEQRLGVVRGDWPVGTPELYRSLLTRFDPDTIIGAFARGNVSRVNILTFPSAEDLDQGPDREALETIKLEKELKRMRQIVQEIIQENRDSVEKFDPEQHAQLVSIKEKMYKPLDVLEQIVIMSRYGTEDGIGKTQEQVGVIIGRSRSTVGRIERRALRKIRQHVKADEVGDFL